MSRIEMRFIVCGGRKYNNREYLFRVLDAMYIPAIQKIRARMQKAESRGDSLFEQISDPFHMPYRIYDKTNPHDYLTLIHGKAKGADQLAGQWAKERGVRCIALPADWKRHGRKAGILRNHSMLTYCPDFVISFRGGTGTAHMRTIAANAGIPVIRKESK